MNRKLIKRIFPLIAIILLAPWPVAYAYDNANTPGQEAVKVTVAESKAAPHGTVFSKTTGSVTPGDFFYIDATGGTNNIAVTLYITNAAEVSRSLRYLILKVGVYVEPVAGEWQKASAANGEPIPDTFITLENGTVSFTLASPASYKITIDSGSYYCPTTRAGVASPQFNLEVK